MKKQIVCLSHTSEFTGGAEAVLISLIATTSDYLDWTVIVPADVGGFVERLRGLEVTVRVVVAFTPWWCSGSSYGEHVSEERLKGSLSRIRREVARSDFTFTNSMVNPWLAYCAKLENKPHLSYIHEFGDIDHGLKFTLGYKHSLKFISENSNKIITISDAVKEHISTEEVRGVGVNIIPQAIDLVSLTAIPEARYNDGKIRLLLLGAIKSSKGQLLLIEALEKLNKKDFLRLDVRIAGPVADKEFCRLLKERVEVLSDRIEVIDKFTDSVVQYEWANVVVVPSLNEALGRTTIEAVASGRVVIGSNSGATPEILGGGIGALFEPGNPNDLARVISCVIQDGEKGLVPMQQRIDSVASRFNEKKQRSAFLAELSFLENIVDKSDRNKESVQVDLMAEMISSGQVEPNFKNCARLLFRGVRGLGRRLLGG